MIETYYNKANQYLEQGNLAAAAFYCRLLPSSHAILVLTEDGRLAESFRSRYGERAIMTDCKRTDNDVGVHYLPTPDRPQLGFEVMRDSYLGVKADLFIGNGASNVSAIIDVMRTAVGRPSTLIAENALFTETSGPYVS